MDVDFSQPKVHPSLRKLNCCLFTEFFCGGQPYDKGAVGVCLVQ